MYETEFMCVLHLYTWLPQQPEEGRAAAPLELDLGCCEPHVIWVLGTKPRPSARVAIPLNSLAVSPSPQG